MPTKMPLAKDQIPLQYEFLAERALSHVEQIAVPKMGTWAI
jgi:hypothetical protein